MLHRCLCVRPALCAVTSPRTPIAAVAAVTFVAAAAATAGPPAVMTITSFNRHSDVQAIATACGTVVNPGQQVRNSTDFGLPGGSLVLDSEIEGDSCYVLAHAHEFVGTQAPSEGPQMERIMTLMSSCAPDTACPVTGRVRIGPQLPGLPEGEFIVSTHNSAVVTFTLNTPANLSIRIAYNLHAGIVGDFQSANTFTQLNMGLSNPFPNFIDSFTEVAGVSQQEGLDNNERVHVITLPQSPAGTFTLGLGGTLQSSGVLNPLISEVQVESSIACTVTIRAIALTDPLPGDLNGDTYVDGSDLGGLLSDWGKCTGSCQGDLNGDGQVNGADLGELLTNWYAAG